MLTYIDPVTGKRMYVSHVDGKVYTAEELKVALKKAGL